MLRLSFFLLIPLTICSSNTSAQCLCERFNNEISIFSTIGSKKHQSFWLTHNRYGIFDDASGNALTLISRELKTRKEHLFDIGGGLDILARGSQESTLYLHQAYIEAKIGFLQFYAGRKATTYGISFSDLSSGAMAISQNSIPIPRVSLSVPDFFEVPYSFGWLELRGHFSHGWLNDPRYVNSSYIHDKSVHIQTGGETGFKFYWGLNHIAI